MSRAIGVTILIAMSFALTGQRLARADAAMVAEPVARYPAWLLQVPESVHDILVAETDTATMHRFTSSGGQIVEADQRYLSIGQNGVGKERAWDRRTPLGVYFVTESLDTSKLHEKYGIAAFPLDYPNAWDRHNQRSGDGIWLHGVDRHGGRRPPRDTDGCLALPNADLLGLVDRLEPFVTPLIVTRKMQWTLPTDLQRLRTELNGALERWRSSLERGDLVDYLSLYADDFSYRDMDRLRWSAWRLNVFHARNLQGVELKDVLLLADPEESGLYLSRFTQVLATAEGTVTTTKRLYWRRGNGNEWQIVTEDSG